MELKLLGHDCLYQVEQLQQALFSLDHPGEATSTVERTPDTVTFSTRIQVGDKVTFGDRQLPVAQESLPVFYKCLRQSYFDAALPHLPEAPAWGALVRPPGGGHSGNYRRAVPVQPPAALWRGLTCRRQRQSP